MSKNIDEAEFSKDKDISRNENIKVAANIIDGLLNNLPTYEKEALDFLNKYFNDHSDGYLDKEPSSDTTNIDILDSKVESILKSDLRRLVEYFDSPLFLEADTLYNFSTDAVDSDLMASIEELLINGKEHTTKGMYDIFNMIKNSIHPYFKYNKPMLRTIQNGEKLVLSMIDLEETEKGHFLVKTKEVDYSEISSGSDPIWKKVLTIPHTFTVQEFLDILNDPLNAHVIENLLKKEGTDPNVWGNTFREALIKIQSAYGDWYDTHKEDLGLDNREPKIINRMYADYKLGLDVQDLLNRYSNYYIVQPPFPMNKPVNELLDFDMRDVDEEDDDDESYEELEVQDEDDDDKSELEDLEDFMQDLEESLLEDVIPNEIETSEKVLFKVLWRNQKDPKCLNEPFLINEEQVTIYGVDKINLLDIEDIYVKSVKNDKITKIDIKDIPGDIVTNLDDLANMCLKMGIDPRIVNTPLISKIEGEEQKLLLRAFPVLDNVSYVYVSTAEDKSDIFDIDSFFIQDRAITEFSKLENTLSEVGLDPMLATVPFDIKIDNRVERIVIVGIEDKPIEDIKNVFVKKVDLENKYEDNLTKEVLTVSIENIKNKDIKSDKTDLPKDIVTNESDIIDILRKWNLPSFLVKKGFIIDEYYLNKTEREGYQFSKLKIVGIPQNFDTTSLHPHRPNDDYGKFVYVTDVEGKLSPFKLALRGLRTAKSLDLPEVSTQSNMGADRIRDPKQMKAILKRIGIDPLLVDIPFKYEEYFRKKQGDRLKPQWLIIKSLPSVKNFDEIDHLYVAPAYEKGKEFKIDLDQKTDRDIPSFPGLRDHLARDVNSSRKPNAWLIASSWRGQTRPLNSGTMGKWKYLNSKTIVDMLAAMSSHKEFAGLDLVKKYEDSLSSGKANKLVARALNMYDPNISVKRTPRKIEYMYIENENKPSKTGSNLYNRYTRG